MKRFEYVIKDKLGLHARPAGMLVKTATKTDCDVKIAVNGRTVDAKRIMGVMSLGAKCGDTIEIICEYAGNGDENEAIDMLKKFLEENL